MHGNASATSEKGKTRRAYDPLVSDSAQKNRTDCLDSRHEPKAVIERSHLERYGSGVMVPVGATLGDMSGEGLAEALLQFARHVCMSR